MSDPNTIYTQALSNSLVAEALFVPEPAWVWSVSGENILWSNEAGCRFFDTKSLPDLLSRRFRRVSPATVQIARMATNVEPGVKVESTLRFFRGMNPVTISATLERIVLADGRDAIFVRAEADKEKAKSYKGAKEDLRLMKLFSRGDAPAALLSSKGKLKEASNSFRDADIDENVLNKAVKKLKDKPLASVQIKDDDRFMHLSAIRDAKGSLSDIFVTLSKEKLEFLEKDQAVDKAEEPTAESITDDVDDVVSDKEIKKSVADTDQDDFTFQPKETPTRFLFTLSKDQEIASLSPELIETVGPETGDVFGQNWADVLERYNMDMAGTIARKIQQESIWTETIHWPISGTTDAEGITGALRVPVTMTAMPIFNSVRGFEGFRGFGSIETNQAKHHPDLDIRPQKSEDEGDADASKEEWESFLATTPLPEDTAPLPEDNEQTTSSNKQNKTKKKSKAKSKDKSKVVSLHQTPNDLPKDEDEASTLSTTERTAFKQIAETLNARIKSGKKDARKGKSNKGKKSNVDIDAASIVEGHVKPLKVDRADLKTLDERAAEKLESASLGEKKIDQSPSSRGYVAKGLGTGAAAILGSHDTEHDDQYESSPDEMLATSDSILNRLPLGLIVSRNRKILFANQSVLDFLGYDDVRAFQDADGIDTLFQPNSEDDPASLEDGDILKHLVITADQQEGHIPQAVRVKMADGTTAAVDLRLQSGDWQGDEALLMALTAKTDAAFIEVSDGERMSELLGQSTDVMDIASDGILIIDEKGKIIHANSSAEALFSQDRSKMRDTKITTLFAKESQKSIRDYLDGLTSNGVASVLNDGRELIGLEANGGLIPLFITIGKLEKNERFSDGVFCVVLRDITQWKRAEEELLESRRIAENANAQKSDFLASISHEIRTPLNAIIGFSEVMKEEHYGPMENPRYLEYARDINSSGIHLMSLVNDLLDLSKIEAGKLDLTFSSVALNPVIQECVAVMQPEANKDRIIIRTSLMESIPPVVADARSIRQIVFNLLSNAVKFTEKGGQVIISTIAEENGEVSIRVRDTGIGMSKDDLEYAMEPFRQVQADQNGRKPGTGLGLPITRALTEANRARFTIDSRVDYGTLIQVIFPNERVLAR